MANLKKRLPNNVAGEFFVDQTCINCDACRQLAPQSFADDGDHSYVYHQPADRSQNQAALRALLACPTSSIGTVGKNQARVVMEEFPIPLDDGVYYCGFHSEKSFGASSYFFQHPEGNWMVDSPRFLPFLAKQLEALGGVRYIFLTHRDDVADSEKYAKRFGAERILHEKDRKGRQADLWLKGEEPVAMGKHLTIIPTPGHTRGHCVLLYQNKYLFSGDHLWWSRHTQALGASYRVCWYDWGEQTRSMERLLDYDFEWVLPGHGRRVHYPLKKMKSELGKLVEHMKKQ